MNRGLSPLLVWMGLGLAACKGSLCERAADLDCEDPPPDVPQCEENIEQDCSDSDVDHLEAYLDCVEEAGTLCETQPTVDEAEAMERCFEELEQISDACLIAEPEGGR
jgi:hypothetical protein